MNEVSHFAGVGFSTTVDFAEAASADYPMYAKVVHRQLKKKQQNNNITNHELQPAVTSVLYGTRNFRTTPVSYTHLTLPTNREV